MEEVLKIIYLNKDSKQKITTILTELKNLATMTDKADYIKSTRTLPNIIQQRHFGNSIVICQNTEIVIFQVEETSMEQCKWTKINIYNGPNTDSIRYLFLDTEGKFY